MGNPIWFIFWFLVFWFISFVVAFFCANIYIVLLVFVVCIPDLAVVTDFLLLCVQFPQYCAQAMIECRSPC